MTVSLTFHGAVGTVTGSCYALEHGGEIVLVDCGLFQGTKSVRELNYAPLPFDIARLKAVLVTHAHIDHCGLLPKLVAQGWFGPIHTTAASADLMDFMLRDTAHIQEFEVDRLNRRNRRRGRPAVEPIYTREDANRAITMLRPAALNARVGITDWLTARFWNAGHILGAASIEAEVAAKASDKSDGPMRLFFSGDLGPGDKAFHDDPDGPVEGIDHLVMESTYGGRVRPALDEAARQEKLRDVMRAALRRGGPVLMPVFAVERTQELLFDLDQLIDRGELPDIETFLDSPLAIRATEAFDRHLPHVNVPGTPHPFRRDSLHLVMEAKDSKRIARLRGPILIMAGSGMCDAGRIREHMIDHLWRPETSLIIVGYQAPGTLGRLLADGVKRLRIHGEEVKVAGQVEVLDIYSGHADATGLGAWAKARGSIGGSLFITHGEEAERAALAQRLIDQGQPARRIVKPTLDARYGLRPGKAAKGLKDGAPRAAAHDLAQPKDWHNRYAAATVSLSDSLRAAPDDKARNRILDRLEKALGKGASK
jgi:metallo-beta-lactamase family protein